MATSLQLLKMRSGLPTRILLLLALAAGSGYTASLTGTGQTAYPGASTSVSLSLGNGAQPVSAVQFDLTWDATLDVHVVPGAQAGIANKTILASFLQPRVLRCLIVGMNASAVGDGELIRLLVAVNSKAPAGSAQITLLNLSAAGADGAPIFLQGGAIGVPIQAGSGQSLQASGILNGASLLSGPICPGEIVTLMGSIAGSSPTVLFNGVPAPLLYAGVDQVNVIVPFGLDPSKPAQLEVRQDATSATASIAVAAAAPAIFTLSATGIGSGAILNQDYSMNSMTRPAARGSAIMIYATGFGALTPMPVDGQIAHILAATTAPVTATIDGVPAKVLYAGAAPDLINGAVQINVAVPDGVSPNPAAPITLSMGSFTTQPGVTVSIK